MPNELFHKTKCYAKKVFRHLRRHPAKKLAAFGASISIFLCVPAFSFEWEKGELSITLDTTISHGLTWRVQGRDAELIGLSNDGSAFSVNADDGNLNYDRGLVSNRSRITSDLELSYRNFGAFIRGNAFYDFENEHSSRDRTELSSDALDQVGSDVELLDNYVWGSFDLGNLPLEVRIGDQVVSWGESTFIQNSINVINPVDVNAIRLPGSQLREALLPEGLIWANLGVNENLSLELVYLYDWNETEIDPPGSYFSNNDFAGDGGTHVFLGFGGSPDVAPFPFFASDPSRPFLGVPRDSTQQASRSGQYGVALRWFVPQLNGTEFALYALNYHSRLPIVNGRTGTQSGAVSAAAAGPAAAAAIYQSLGVTPGSNPEIDQQATAAANAAATDAYAATAGVFLSYPEDISLYGLSFNTVVGKLAVQGEISYRQNAPLQVDDVEVLFSSLSPISPFLAVNNQIGAFGFDQEVSGFVRRPVVQLQFTVTQLFGPLLGANQGVLIWEGAVTRVNGMPDKNRLRLDGPGTFVSGNPLHEEAGLQPVTMAFSQFADATSWGYRLAGQLDYQGVIGAINLSPRFSFQHDVNGTSPGPGGNFIEGRKAVTVGLKAVYQEAIEIDASYTTFFGADSANLINDRDFVGINFRYSF